MKPAFFCMTTWLRGRRLDPDDLGEPGMPAAVASERHRHLARVFTVLSRSTSCVAAVFML
jgi:hypothetical protein